MAQFLAGSILMDRMSGSRTYFMIVSLILGSTVLTVINTVLQHNGGFCNGYITQRCLHTSTNVSYSDLVSQLHFDKKMKKIKKSTVLSSYDFGFLI